MMFVGSGKEWELRGCYSAFSLHSISVDQALVINCTLSTIHEMLLIVLPIPKFKSHITRM
jgi:hypothetical protein